MTIDDILDTIAKEHLLGEYWGEGQARGRVKQLIEAYAQQIAIDATASGNQLPLTLEIPVAPI